MQTVPGVELRRMPDEERCCGSAGIYNVVQYDESMKLLDLKMSSVKEAGAHTVVTTNPGCLLQMQCGIAREGLRHRMRAVHLAEWLAEHVEQAKSVKNQKTEGE